MEFHWNFIHLIAYTMSFFIIWFENNFSHWLYCFWLDLLLSALQLLRLGVLYFYLSLVVVLDHACITSSSLFSVRLIRYVFVKVPQINHIFLALIHFYVAKYFFHCWRIVHFYDIRSYFVVQCMWKVMLKFPSF